MMLAMAASQADAGPIGRFIFGPRQPTVVVQGECAPQTVQGEGCYSSAVQGGGCYSSAVQEGGCYSTPVQACQPSPPPAPATGNGCFDTAYSSRQPYRIVSRSECGEVVTSTVGGRSQPHEDEDEDNERSPFQLDRTATLVNTSSHIPKPRPLQALPRGVNEMWEDEDGNMTPKVPPRPKALWVRAREE